MISLELQAWAGAAKFDEVDASLINCFNWYAHKQGTNTYARTDVWANGIRRSYMMHRLIMGAKPGQIVDHINGDGLDNRRCNLRFATSRQNARNGRSRGGYSSFKGVTLDKRRGAWVAQIGYDYKRLSIGGFEDELTAAAAYDLLAQHFHGEFARLNLGVLFLEQAPDGSWKPAIQPHKPSGSHEAYEHAQREIIR